MSAAMRSSPQQLAFAVTDRCCKQSTLVIPDSEGGFCHTSVPLLAGLLLPALCWMVVWCVFVVVFLHNGQQGHPTPPNQHAQSQRMSVCGQHSLALTSALAG
jgi:hypothetical protein